MLQRSKDWYNARAGKFTASEIYKIMGVKGLGQTGETYALEKAIESVFGRLNEDVNFISYDMQRGIDLEPIAFEKIKELKSLDFIDVRESSFYSYGPHAGASPDGLVGKTGVLEIKCPQAAKFFKLICNNEIDKEYFYQMQFQMLVTGKPEAYFFNYIIHNSVPMWHEIVVLRCEKTQEKMKERLKEAIILKKTFVEKIKSNNQFTIK